MWYFRGVPEVEAVSSRDFGTQTDPVVPERPWVATLCLVIAMLLVTGLP